MEPRRPSPSCFATRVTPGAAVGAFNVYNVEGALAVRRAVERRDCRPSRSCIRPMRFGGTALIAACKEVAAGCTAAPLLVQLDHADDEDSIRAALGAGVDGVMADGSGYPLDENMVWTARMAALAHASGATVEAELGRLAGEEDGLSIDEKDAKMTDPAVVGRFLAATSVDALAVTIGNVHGKYAKAEPELDWPRLDAVRDAAGGRHGTPLVLHGASGLPEPMHRDRRG